MRCEHDEVVAVAGLRDGKDKLSAQVQVPLIDARDAWRCLGNRQSQIALNQVLCERGGVSGAASCASDNHTGWLSTKAEEETVERPCQIEPPAAR